MYTESKTSRTLVVSMMGGPPGQLLPALEYSRWLDQEEFDHLSCLAEGTIPLEEVAPRLRRRRQR